MWWISKTKSDNEIVRRVLQGRRDEFGLLVERYLPSIRAVAYARTGNFADAQDIAQETFIKAYERLNTLRDVACLGAWLATMARNEASRLTRQASHRDDLLRRNAASQEAVIPEVERRELRDLLHSQIQSLPEDHREVLLLHYFAGKRAREIAAVQGISTDAVKKRLQRAREALSKSMTAQLPDLLETGDARKRSAAKVMGLIALASPPWQAASATATGAAATAGGTLLAIKASLIALAIAGIAGPLLWYQLAPESPAPTGNAVTTEALPATTPVAQTVQASATEAGSDEQSSTAVGSTRTAIGAVAVPGTSGGSITGRVFDRDTDAGIAGVHVWATPVADDGAVAGPAGGIKALTGADGRYVLEGFAEGTYRVARSDPDGYRSELGRDEQDLLMGPGEMKEGIDFALVRGYSVSGTVVDQHGKPVSKAELYVQAGDRPISIGAKSNKDGKFVVKNLPPTHTLRLQAHTAKDAPDMPFQSEVMGPLEILDADLEGLVVELRQPCDRRITGIVVSEDGAPLVSIRVYAMPGDYRSFPSGGESDQNGRFEIEALAAGRYKLALQRAGTSTWSVSPDTPSYEVHPDADLEDVRLVLDTQDRLSISGRVVDASGNPATGADVMVRARHLSKSQRLETENDGRYSIAGLAEGTYEVSVTHEKLTGQERQGVPAGSTGVDFILQERGAIAGHVVDADTGKPIEAFSINPTTVMESAFPGGGTSSRYSSPGFLEVRSKNGEFLLFGREARKTIVTAQAPGYSPEKVEVVVVPGKTTSGISIALERGQPLSGRVVNEAGMPVPGALLYWNSVPHDPERNAAARTDRDGQFIVEVLAPDVRRILAYHPDYAIAIEDFPAHEVRPLEIVLQSGATVQGFVRLDGEGVANARLSLTYWRIGGFLSDLTTQSGPDGSYAFTHVNETDVRVTASIPVTGGQGAQRSFFREAVANPEAPVILDFDFGALTASLEGTVTLHGTVPIKTWISLAMHDDGAKEYFRTSADAAGYYVIENIPSGPGELEVWAEDGDLRSRKIVPVIVPSGQSSRLDVDLAGSASLLINMLSANTGASPTIYLLPYETQLPPDPISPNIMQNWDAVATSVWEAGDARTIRIDRLERGTYTAVAVWDLSADTMLASAATVTLEDGESQEIDL